MLIRALSPRRSSGFTLLETMVAVGIIATFIAVLIVVNSNVLSLLRTSKDNVSANQMLQERAEQLRLASWGELTNAQKVATNILNADSVSGTGLSKPIETLVISPYPAKAGYTPEKIIRQNGVSTVVTSNAALVNERLVRVDLTLTWNGYPKKRDRSRATTILIAKSSSGN